MFRWTPRLLLLLCIFLAFGCSSDPGSAEMEGSDFEEVPLTEADLGKTL